MKINVHGGHNRHVPGIISYLDEVTEDRRIKNAVIAYLRKEGHTVYDCTESDARTQRGNLSGIEGSGTIKLNHVSSYFISKILDDIKKGKSTPCTIISNLDDPSVEGNERVKMTGCTFDEIKIADWEAGKLGEESIPFTFADADVIDAIPD